MDAYKCGQPGLLAATLPQLVQQAAEVPRMVTGPRGAAMKRDHRSGRPFPAFTLSTCFRVLLLLLLGCDHCGTEARNFKRKTRPDASVHGPVTARGAANGYAAPAASLARGKMPLLREESMLPFPADFTRAEVGQVLSVLASLKMRVRWMGRESPGRGASTKLVLLKINRSASTELFSRLSALPQVCASFSELDRVLFYNKPFQARVPSA
eukprot:scaffold1439_cov404-Prasinococcus_capsulatus_cf.AAC.29